MDIRTSHRPLHGCGGAAAGARFMRPAFTGTTTGFVDFLWEVGKIH
jgi:hypothetical protein